MYTTTQKSKTQNAEDAKSIKANQGAEQTRRSHSLTHLQQTVGNQTVQRLLQSKSDDAEADQSSSDAENRTGMPTPLKHGLEALSGMDLSDIRVHKNSAKPARLNALAYTQNQDIHIAPGQEDHLPHESWHAVQQMQGRVKPMTSVNGISINNDERLEREADVMGAKASEQGGEPDRRRKRDENTARTYQRASALQSKQNPVTQMNPAAGAFLGLSAAAWGTAANVVGVVTTVGGVGAGAYSAATRGESDVGSLVLPEKLMSEEDKRKLREIIQFRIINAYIERFLARPENSHLRQQLLSGQGGGAPTTGGTPTTTSGGEGTGTGGPSPEGSERPTGAPTASAIDQEVLTQVRNAIENDVKTELETDPQPFSYEYRWGEDDTYGQGPIGQSGESESVGVTGYLQFRNLRTSALQETLSLSPVAQAAVGPLPNQGNQVVVHHFLGGTVDGWVATSIWDDLTVNVAGGRAQESIHENGSIKLIILTEWAWSFVWGYDTETRMQHEIYVLDDGRTRIDGTKEGSP